MILGKEEREDPLKMDIFYTNIKFFGFMLTQYSLKRNHWSKMKRRISSSQSILSTLPLPFLNRSRIIFSSKFRNTILLTHLFLPDHFRMELGRGGGVGTIPRRYYIVAKISLERNDSSGEGVFFLIRNTPNKGNWWFRGGKEKNNKNNRRRGVHNEIKSRGKKVRPSGERCEISKGGPPLPPPLPLPLPYFSPLPLSNRLAFVALSLAAKMKNGFLSGPCATFLSSGRINYGTPDRESWGRGDPWYLQTARTKIMRSGDTRRASRASYKVLNLSSIVIAFRL